MADGSAVIGLDTLPGSVDSDGFYSIPAVDAEFAVSAGRDVMIGLSSTPAEVPLRILTKRPASLSVSDLAGSWQYREYAILPPQPGSALYPIEIQALNVSLGTGGSLAIEGDPAGTAQVGSDRNVILNLGDELLSFAINDSKDLMVSLLEEQGELLLRLVVRQDVGGSTADLQGVWSLARFGINQQVPDMGFALENANFSVGAAGNAVIGGESITLGSAGQGTVSVTDSEGVSLLVWSRSRQLLLEAESQDSEFALPLALRRAGNVTAADLTGTWDLHELTISSPELTENVAEAFDAGGSLAERYEFITGNDGQRLRNGLSVSFYPGGQVRQQETRWLADAEAGTSVKNGTATRYHFDGETEQCREQWALGVLHGEPAVQEWDSQGRETLNEFWNAGVITRSLESAYDDLEPTLLSSQILTTYTEGEKATELREFYHRGSSALESRISLVFANGVETQRNSVNFKIDGVARTDDLERTFDPLTGITEESRRTYLEDGVGLYTSEFIRFLDPAHPLVEIFANYHEDGVTVFQRTTRTASESGVSILTERFYASGQESYRGTTDAEARLQGTVITWHENGNVASRTNYSNGVQHGLTEQYNAAAQPTFIATYAFGEIVESTMTTYYADGTQQFEQVTLNGDEQVITSRQWYANGQLQFQTRYVDNLRDGVQKNFDELGNPTSEQNYSADELDGPSYQWHAGTVQLATERNYTAGLLNGFYRDWYANGQLQIQASYVSGLLHGPFHSYRQDAQPLRAEEWVSDQMRSQERWSYHNDGAMDSHVTSSIRFGDLRDLPAEESVAENFDGQGRISSYAEYRYGQYHGEVRSYHEGVLMSRSRYQDGLLDGLQEIFLYTDNTSDPRFGKLASRSLYSRGLRNGLSEEFDPATGLPVKQIHYQRGIWHGNYKEFSNETLVYEGEYVHGARDGLHTTYRADGTLQQKATYESDVLDGLWVDYYEDEQISIQRTYDRGLKAGLWVWYRTDGSLSQRAEYLADHRNGIYETFDDQGRLNSRWVYRNGVLDGLSEIFASGVLSSSTVYDNGAEVGPRKGYHANGQLASNTPLVLGRAEGLVIHYYADGQVSQKSNYRAGLLHGSSEGFYEDGPRATLENFSAGVPNGSYQRWYSNGQLQESGSYSDGVHCGTWRYYDQAGNLTNEENYGSCPGAGDPEFPIARGFEGVVRLNGQAVPGVFLRVASGEEFQSSFNVAGDGSFRYPLAQGSVLTSFTLTVQAGPGWLEKEVNVTVPMQDGFVPVTIDLEPAENTAPIIRPLNNSRSRSISFPSETYDFVSLPAIIEIPFTIADTETDADSLETTFNLSTPALFQSAELLGVGAQRYVRLTPKPDTAGNSMLTVTVSDGELSSQATAELRFAHAMVSRILRGSASVLRAGQFQPLAAGDPVFEGEIVKTDALGIIRLQTPEGSVFTIGSDSEMQINRVEAREPGIINLIRAKLIKGFSRVEATDNPDRDLEVTTRTAAIGVRGTIFEVTVDEVDGLPRTQIVVEEGLVETTDVATGAVLQLGVGESGSIVGSPQFTYNHVQTGVKSGHFDFTAHSGYTYQLQRSIDLSFDPQSTEIVDEVQGNGADASLSYDDSQSSAPMAFFRVARLPL